MTLEVIDISIPDLITEDMVKEVVVTITIRVKKDQDSVTVKPKMVGDTHFEGVRKKINLTTSLKSWDVGFTSVQRQ